MHKWLLSLELLKNRRIINDNVIIEYYGIDISIQEREYWGFGYECIWYDGPWESFKLGPFTIGFGWMNNWEKYSDWKSSNTYPTNNWIKRMCIIDKLFNIFRLIPTKEKP